MLPEVSVPEVAVARLDASPLGDCHLNQRTRFRRGDLCFGNQADDNRTHLLFTSPHERRMARGPKQAQVHE